MKLSNIKSTHCDIIHFIKCDLFIGRHLNQEKSMIFRQLAYVAGLNPIAYGILQSFQIWQGGGEIFYLTPQKTMFDYLIYLKFGTDNKSHKTIKKAKFQNICCSTF